MIAYQTMYFERKQGYYVWACTLSSWEISNNPTGGVTFFIISLAVDS